MSSSLTLTLMNHPSGRSRRQGRMNLPAHGGHAAPAPGRQPGSHCRRLARAVAATAMAWSSAEASAAAAKQPAGRGGPTYYAPPVARMLSYLDAQPMRLTSTPMVYEAGLSDAHMNPIVHGLRPEDVAPPSNQAASSPSSMHHARVVAALLYLAAGGLDHAHNLVTPLSWGAPTAYAGQPIAGSPAAQDAAYVHALIHRAEGLCDGEFGSGFSNANYWYAATGQHPIYPRVLQAAQRAAAASARLQGLVANHGSAFSPPKFVSVCAQAASSKDPELVSWCERVINAEWRLLLDHCCTRMS